MIMRELIFQRSKTEKKSNHALPCVRAISCTTRTKLDETITGGEEIILQAARMRHARRIESGRALTRHF